MRIARACERYARSLETAIVRRRRMSVCRRQAKRLLSRVEGKAKLVGVLGERGLDRLCDGAAFDQSRSLQIPSIWSRRRGGAAAPSALYLVRDGQTQALPSKVTNMMLKSGDIIRLETSSGGFGEARLRAREHVERDVRLGYVSAAAAKRSCGQNG